MAAIHTTTPLASRTVKKLSLWAVLLLMLGDFTICTGMSGNGVGIYTANTLLGNRLIRVGQQKAHSE